MNIDLDASIKFCKILRDRELSPNVPKGSNLQDYYDAGVIRKEDLVDGAYYQGICRNDSIAQWDAKKNSFWYMRDKSGYKYKEYVNYISDDDGCDIFLPFIRLEDD